MNHFARQFRMCHRQSNYSQKVYMIISASADRGIYIASESSFYKVLKEANKLAHRGREHKKQKRSVSTHKASASNQIWMWDHNIFEWTNQRKVLLLV